MSEHECKYYFYHGRQGNLLRFIPITMVVISLPISVFGIIGYSLISILGAKLTTQQWFEWYTVWFFLYFNLNFIFPSLNELNDILITNEGINIRVYSFIFYWKHLSWEDIINIEQSPFVDRLGSPLWIIKVKNLTKWHEMIARKYKITEGSAIVLSSDMPKRDELITLIQNKLKKEEEWR